MKTDTSEKGLETLIMRHMTGKPDVRSTAANLPALTPLSRNIPRKTGIFFCPTDAKSSYVPEHKQFSGLLGRL